MSRSSRPLILFFLICLCFFQTVVGQNSSNSPYSRFGIGDIKFNGPAKNVGMGTVGCAFNQPFTINFSNPAGYSGLFLTTYEGGINMSQYELSSGIQKQKSFTSSLAYFGFGFPVKVKKWGIGFGLLPYSNVGYSVKQIVNNTLGVGELHTYNGSGGLNQFYFSNGFALNKKISLGFTVSYLFGQLNHDRTIEFDSQDLFNTKIYNSSSLGWFNYNFGFQYTIDSLRIAPSDSLKLLKKQLHELSDSLHVLDDTLNKVKPGDSKDPLLISRASIRSSIKQVKELSASVKHRKDKSDWNLTCGFTVSPSSELRGRNTYLAENFKYYAIGVNQYRVRDTIEYHDGEKGFVKLPLNLSLGLAMKKGTKWLIGTDLSTQKWKNFTFFGRPDSLVDSWRIAAGVQFTPNDRAIKSYWKTLQYRAGFHYERTFLQLKGTQLEETAISLGVSLPIRRVATVLHFAFEGGKRGTTENNLIQEKYVRVTVGFTLNDRWFIKPKYD